MTDTDTSTETPISDQLEDAWRAMRQGFLLRLDEQGFPLTKCFPATISRALVAERDALTAEVARLREALTSISKEHREWTLDDTSEPPFRLVDTLANVARTALKGADNVIHK